MLICGFYPEYRMKNFRSPNTREMVDGHRKAKFTGLKNIRLGNLGVFIRNDQDREYLMGNVEKNAV